MIQIPAKLQNEAINFVLLERSGKKPFQKDWQKREIKWDDEELLQHISKGGNYGVLGGGVQKLIIVDFDDEDVQEDAIQALPETFTVKTGSGLLHKYYWCNGEESFKVFDEDMNTLADIQGKGKQVVGATSIHPNGNTYDVVDDREIASVEYSELKAIMMFFDKKPQKEQKINDDMKPSTVESSDNFLDKLKSNLSMEQVLSHIGIDTSHNPTQCPFHDSRGGKCLGFKDEMAHCFHCDGSWNIYSLIKKYKDLDFKGALEYLADLAGMNDELADSRKEYMAELIKNENSVPSKFQEVKTKYLELSNLKQTAEATECLVEHIESVNHIYTTRNDNKPEIYIYKEGIYVPEGKTLIEEQLRKILGDNYNKWIAGQVLDKVRADTGIDADVFFADREPYKIPVKNGILDLKKLQLEDFDPEKIYFSKLETHYEPGTTCPKIDKFLKEVLASEEDIEVFYEMAGFSLVKDYFMEKAIMMVGSGRNGKSKTIELLKKLIGVENCSSIALSSISANSPFISDLFGKHLNLAGDVSSKDFKDTGMFKSLTGRDVIAANRKYKNVIKFQNYAKFVFACNELPRIYDYSDGFWERWILLEFPYYFADEDVYNSATEEERVNWRIKNPNIIEEITMPGEMSGFLNMALLGLHRLFDKKKFSYTAGTAEVKLKWVRKSDSFMAFCMDKLVEDFDSKISKKVLRKEYSKYCREHRSPGVGDTSMKITLQEKYGASEEYCKVYEMGHQEWHWVGVKIA